MIPNPSGYWKQDNKVYFRHYLVKGADSQSFQALNDTWGIDKDRAYVVDRHLRLADRESFVVLNHLFAKDRHHAFYVNGKIKEAKAASFEVLDTGCTPDPYGQPRYQGYARDQEHVFFYWLTFGKPCIVRGAKAESFRVIQYLYATDGQNVFWGRRIDGADVASFEVLHPQFARDAQRVYWCGEVLPGADRKTFRILDAGAQIAEDERSRYKCGERTGFRE